MALELPLSLDERGPLPLHRQLYEGLRRAILDGRLLPGSRVPSTRALANQLHLSRNTVSGAYDQLLAEGYFTARIGSGTYVCEALPDELFQVPRRGLPARPSAEVPVPAPVRLSRWMQRAREGAPELPVGPAATRLPYNFRHGSSALDQFPAEIWRRLLARRLRALDHTQFGYAASNGYEPLRQAVAGYLQHARAVRCTPEQVLIVNGSQQGLDLLARVCLDPGDSVLLEDPSYLGARRVFAAHGAQLLSVPVDGAGLVTAALDAATSSGTPRLVYVTPSHQFPTGALLSLPRRLALLRWARAHGTLVLEDDYDSEFRYTGRPVEALQGLDDGNTVIYMGTFSKVLIPALRIGYLVLPPSLVESVSMAKWLSDRHTALLEQQALADFFAEGHFERHLRHMRTIYQARHDAFLTALQRELGDLVLQPLADTGLHVQVTFRMPLSEEALIARAAQAGVAIYSARPYYLNPPAETHLVMGFTNLSEERIAMGLRRLGQVVRALLREQGMH